MVSLIKLADTTESIFNLGVLLGIFIAICILWIQKTIEFANRPCVVYRDDAKNTYRLVQQRPMPFYAALLFKLLYIDQIFGKDKSCMTRIIQKLVTFIFNKNRYPCHVKEIEEFAKKNGIINSDGRHMKWTRDLTEFTSIDDFFTRRPAVLPPASLLSRHNLTSPCEGTVVGYETIEAAQRFWIKQKSFCLNSVGIPREFLHNFHNGNIFIFKLDVYDIHHFYSPVTGYVKKRIDFVEPLRHSSSVRPFAMQAGWEILTENRRVLLIIESNTVGLIALLIVGGIGIDTIEIDVNEGDEVIIGADLGCFHMGGSAMIILTPEHYISKGNDMKFPSNKMLSQKKISIRADIACSSLCEFEFKIGIGEKLLQQEQNSRDK